MHTTYHFSSAQDASNELLDSIKATFKSKPITIIIHEDAPNEYDLTAEMMEILDQRLMEDESEYLTSKESINKIAERYCL